MKQKPKSVHADPPKSTTHIPTRELTAAPKKTISFVKSVSVVLFLACVVAVLYAVTTWSLAEHSNELPPVQTHTSGTLVQRIVLDSFDSDTRLVHARASVNLRHSPIRKNQGAAIASDETYQTPFLCVPDGPYGISFDPETTYYGPWDFRDIGRSASQSGLASIQGWPLWGPCLPDKGYTKASAPSANAELFAIGDVRSFPFDSYLILAEVYCPVLVKSTGQDFVGLEAFDIVDPQLPGFVMRYPSPYEIENRIQSASGVAHSEFERYDERKWTGRKIAVVIERPRFLRVLTVTVALFAVIALIFVIAKTPREKLVLDTIGYLISLWALRSIIMVAGPKSPTYLDYGVLFMYVCAFAAVATRLALPRSGEASDLSHK